MPFVVVLQSDLTTFGLEVVVAPLAPDAGIPARPRHLLPAVTVAGRSFAVLVPKLAPIRARNLSRPIADLGHARDPIVAAIDLLFLGV